MTAEKTSITVATTVNAPAAKVWEFYTEPEHIVKWNTPSADWHTTAAKNDLKAGGKFLSRMEARDGSFGFDFTGTYDEVQTNELIAYTMDDGRQAKVTFAPAGNATVMTVVFDAETQNSIEMQQGGWQAIVDSFGKYTENN